jgi:hypothetical protein
MVYRKPEVEDRRLFCYLILLPCFLKQHEKNRHHRAGLNGPFLFLSRRAYRAGFGTGTAFNADFGIDLILSFTLADSGNGAFASTGTTADAFFGNLVSHDKNLLFH